jgi:hypothetical protein
MEIPGSDYSIADRSQVFGVAFTLPADRGPEQLNKIHIGAC